MEENEKFDSDFSNDKNSYIGRILELHGKLLA